MAILSYIKLRESEFSNIVSKKDKMQDLNIIELKLQVDDGYNKDGRNNSFLTY